MRKIIYFIAFLVLTATITTAKPVVVATAQKAAENFYAGKYSTQGLNFSLAYTETAANTHPVYYVFNVNPGKGFVIISAEDAAYPIIGYSNQGSFVVPTSKNNNAFFWFQKAKKEIISIRTNNIVATSEISNEWTVYTSPNATHAPHRITSEILPLCSTQWDQSPYYNASCPGGSVTGCVATAMAQIMKYWSYPTVGIGSNCYYDQTNMGYSENYGHLCAAFDTSYYAWGAMPYKLSGSNNQVAKLMYDCGVSVNMDYSPQESGAQVLGGYPSAFYSFLAYFGYDQDSIHQTLYMQYAESDWITLLENELNKKRPMQYEGFDSISGGHTWVCDGYSNYNEFHMNWGWGGADDGYFTVTKLNPLVYDFDQGTGVIYGIQPPSSALAVNQVSNNTGKINVYPNPSHGIFAFDIPNSNGSHQVEVYNVLGQEVCTSTISSENAQINLSAQPKGIYIYKLLTTNGDLISAGRLVVE